MEIHSNDRGKLGFGTCPNLNWVIGLGRSAKNWDLKLVKSQLNNQTRFGNLSKRSGKNWDLTFVKSQLSNQTRFGIYPNDRGKIRPGLEFIKTIGEKLGFDICQIAIEQSDPVWNLSKQSGKNWDLTLVKSQLGN